MLSAYRVGRFIFGKRCLIQFPFFHVVFAKGCRRDAGGQGILDGAGVQAGDDRLGDFCKFCVQLLCIARIIGKFLTCFWLRRNFSSQIFTDGNLFLTVRNINCFTCIKADRVELGRNVLNPCRSVNRTIVYLIGALRAITMNTILRAANRQFGSKQMRKMVAVFLQAVRWLTIRQGNHVFDCTPDRVIVQQILRIGQTGIQVRTAFRAQSLDVFQNFLINIRIRYVDPRLYGFSLFCKRHNGDVTAKVAAVLIGRNRTVCVERQAAVGFQEILRSNLRGIQTGCTCGFEVNIIVSESVWGRVLSIFVTFKPARIMLIIRVISATIIGTFELFFSILVCGFIVILIIAVRCTVKLYIVMHTVTFYAALRAICHRDGGVEHQDGRGFAGVLLGLLQDDLKRDFVLVIVRSRFRGLGDSFDAIGQRRSRSARLPLVLVVVFTDHDFGIRRRGLAVPFCRQRYRREQADGQDQRQQQGYDSFHHFFFSPYVWFNFFVFFFRFSMCNGRGAGV